MVSKVNHPKVALFQVSEIFWYTQMNTIVLTTRKPRVHQVNQLRTPRSCPPSAWWLSRPDGWVGNAWQPPRGGCKGLNIQLKFRDFWLVVWNMFLFPHSVVNFIISTDKVIFFRGVAQPPTRFTSCHLEKNLNGLIHAIVIFFVWGSSFDYMTWVIRGFLRCQWGHKHVDVLNWEGSMWTNVVNLTKTSLTV